MSHWHHTAGPHQRTDRPPTRVGVVCLVGLALLLAYSLSGCADPGFRGSAGGTAKTARAAPTPTVPTVEVPNPFFCPRAPA